MPRKAPFKNRNSDRSSQIKLQPRKMYDKKLNLSVKNNVTFKNIDVSVKFKDRNDNQSTWRNFWKKVRILAPFLWPKKDFLLQLRVIFCFVLLGGGRVINLYVPIYNKMIGRKTYNQWLVKITLQVLDCLKKM